MKRDHVLEKLPWDFMLSLTQVDVSTRKIVKLTYLGGQRAIVSYD